MDKNEEEKKNLIEEKTEDRMIEIQPSKLKVFNIFELTFAYISLFVLNNPKMSCFLMVLNLIAVVMIINANVRNAPDISKIIEHDYSGVSSKYDLHLGTIDHWCLGGGDGNCHCEDPLSPSKKKSQIWSKAVDENWFDIKTALRFWGEEKGSIDVVFLGANIVEYWKGRTIGRTTSAFAEEVAGKFKKIFEKGKIKALPLGIAGDTVSNVLWRLQNGELPDNLQPKIWWLVIGDNDMAIKQCSEEVVLMGILRIVEEILDKIPDARIVINSILPMTSNENGFTPNVKFRNVKKLSKQLIEGNADVESEANTRRRLKGDDEDEDNFNGNNNNASKKSSLSGLESKTSLSSQFNNTTTSSSSKQVSFDKSSSSHMLAENTNPGTKNAHAKPIEGNTTTYASTNTVNSNDTEKDLSTITITTNKTIITDDKIAIKSATTNDNNKTVTKSNKEDHNNSNDNTKQSKKSIPTLILTKNTTNGDVDDEGETDSEDIKQEEEKKKEWKTDDDDNGDGDDKPENKGEDERQDKEKKKEWKVWTGTENQKKKWELKWGNKKNKKAEKDSDNDSEKPKKKWRGKKDDEEETLDDEIANGGNNNNKKAKKDSEKDSEKPKKIWKWSGKKDDKKVDDKIGNESQLTSASGEMKPAKGSESVSLWHSVVAINVALSKFCWTNKHVTFFDANDIFIEDRKLITDLILSPNSGQPSVAGHGELLLAIEQKVKDILHADAKKERKIYGKSLVRSKEEDDDEY